MFDCFLEQKWQLGLHRVNGAGEEDRLHLRKPGNLRQLGCVKKTNISNSNTGELNINTRKDQRQNLNSGAADRRVQNKVKLRLNQKYFIKRIVKQLYWVIISKNIWCAGPHF